MVAVDTNVLVYAHRTDAPFHKSAVAAIESLATANVNWAIPWPCVHEFLAIVTNPRVFKSPTPMPIAVKHLQSLAELAHCMLIGEEDDYFEQLAALLVSGQITGGMVHEARIAAICVQHGVTELWSADRDFSRFPALKTRNPVTG